MKQWRFTFILALFVGIAFLLTGRLAVLQITDHGLYKALAQGQQNTSNLAQGTRGSIFLQDKNNDLYTVATNQKVFFVFASPAEIENPTETAQALALVLSLPKETLTKQLSVQESFFEILKKDITPKQQETLQELNIPGIYIQEETVRNYPQASFAARTLGFTNQAGEGQYGIEEYYNEELKGKEGLRKVIANVANYLSGNTQDTLENGSDLVLTLDFNVQSMAESLLEQAQENLNAEAGSIIVMNPTTGALLALASTPSFNPNTYGEVANIGIFKNPMVENIFEPGSVFKAITMAAAINEKAVTPETTYIDKGIVRIGGYKILNYDERLWGQRTMNEVLQYSINTGSVFVEEQLGHEKFLEYVERFGMFQPTQIDMAGEAYSQNRELKKGYEINFATASFGQGIEITPLQLVQAYSAFANNGVMAQPFIVQEIRSQGTTQIQTPHFSAPVISPNTARAITEMLVKVTTEGYAKQARIPGYDVAGKTGTAQVSFSALGISQAGYSDKTVQSFIGYAPAHNPKFLALVTLDNPQTNTAEYSAMPVFRELAKYILDYFAIPPDYTP